MLDDIKKPKTRTLSFAAGLAPLLVESEEPACAKGVFRTSALIAATPHSPTDQKRNTDCSAGRSAVRHATALPNAPLHPPRRRCGSGGGGSGGGEGCGGIPPPPVLRFESWRHERGRRVGLTLHFHVATSELAVRSDDGLEVTVVVYGASGHELEAHDLHVGAALRVLGCPITLRKADPRTAEWLEAEAALLRGHKRRLEDALSAFAPIVRGCGMERDSCGGHGHGHSGGGGGGGCGSAHLGPGGAVNLRRLRDDIALLAGRLRQHKSKVPLPPELQSLVGEGPNLWRLDDPEALRQLAAPYSPPAPRHARAGHQPLRRAFSLAPGPRRCCSVGGRSGGGSGGGRSGGGSQGGSGGGSGGGGGVRPSVRGRVEDIEVGRTPTWVGQLCEWKHEQRLLQLSALAASAVAAGLRAEAAAAALGTPRSRRSGCV